MKVVPTSRAMYLAAGVLFALVRPCAVLGQAQQTPPAREPVSQPVIAPVPAADPAKIPEAAKSNPDIPATPPAYDEIVITAVGDVMLGTTFPADSPLPPNDGADLLRE